MLKSEASDTSLRLKLLPRQIEFYNAREAELLYSGAVGAGKTRALLVKLLPSATQPGNTVGLFRKSRVSLVTTTLRTLLEPDGQLPPVLPPEFYTHIKSESIIHLHGGGSIVYGGFDDQQRWGSMNLGSVYIDEGIELEEEEYSFLGTRIRNQADPYHQLCVATNPGPPTHFLYKRFFEDKAEHRRVISTCSFDNHFLPEHYVERLQRMKGLPYRRLVLGEWVGYEGLIYEFKSCKIHNDEPEYIIGVDAGFHHPAALLVDISIDPPHCVAELRPTEVTEQGFVVLLKAWMTGLGAHFRTPMYVDPSAPSLIHGLRKANLNAKPADNAVLPGISYVQSCGFTIDPSCSNLEAELYSYHWDEKKEDVPVKVDDHGPDALRYGLYSHFTAARDLRLLVT